MTKKKKTFGKRGKKKAINGRVGKFIDNYINTDNATQSAITAGYSPNGAGRTASRLLSKVAIQEEISKRRLGIAQSNNVTATRVIQELAKIAFTNAKDVFSWDKVMVTLQDGQEVGKGVALLKSPEDIPEHAYASISSIKETTQGIEVKLYDKQKALDSLGRYFGVNNDADVTKSNRIKAGEKQQEINDPLADIIEEDLDEEINKLI